MVVEKRRQRRRYLHQSKQRYLHRIPLTKNMRKERNADYRSIVKIVVITKPTKTMDAPRTEMLDGDAEKWCFPVFGKLQSGGRSEKVEALRCFQTSKGVFTISPVLYDCLEVARKSLERDEIFEKNEVPHTYYYCRAGSD